MKRHSQTITFEIISHPKTRFAKPGYSVILRVGYFFLFQHISINNFVCFAATRWPIYERSTPDPSIKRPQTSPMPDLWVAIYKVSRINSVQ